MGASTVTFRVARAKDADISAVQAGTPSECAVWDPALGKLVRKSLAGFALAASLAAYAALAGAQFAGPVQVPAGTAGAPGLGVGAATSGLFRPAADVVGVAAGGAEVARFGPAATTFQGGSARVEVSNAVGVLLDWNSGVARLTLDSTGISALVNGSQLARFAAATVTFSAPVTASGSNYFSAGGSYLGWNGGSPNTDLVAGSANHIPLRVRAFSTAQVENLQEWHGVRADGSLSRVSSISRDGSWGLSEGNNPGDSRLFVQPKQAGHKGLLIRGALGQTANLWEAQDSTGATTYAALSPTAATFYLPVTAKSLTLSNVGYTAFLGTDAQGLTLQANAASGVPVYVSASGNVKVPTGAGGGFNFGVNLGLYGGIAAANGFDVFGNWNPYATGTYTLGSATRQWAELHLSGATITSTTATFSVPVTVSGALTVAALTNTGTTVLGAPTSALADGSLSNSQFSFWLDEAANKLMVKVKYSTGAVKTGEIALA